MRYGHNLEYNPELRREWVDETDTPEEERLRRILKPVEELLTVVPRCCSTCLYLKHGDGSAECLRPNGPGFDLGDGKHWFSVCKGWKNDGNVKLPEKK